MRNISEGIRFGSEFSTKLPDIAKIYISSKHGNESLSRKTVKRKERDEKISEFSQKRDTSNL